MNMKKPNFVLYASGYALCLCTVVAGIWIGIQFDVPAFLVLAGEAAVWSSMIFEKYHERLRAYFDWNKGINALCRLVAARLSSRAASSQEVSDDA